MALLSASAGVDPKEMLQELQQLRELADAIADAGRGKGGLGKRRHLVAQALQQVVGLKETSKRLCSRVEAAREHTTSSKVALEGADSTLQNLLYEKGYYEKEIRACRNFVSKVPDAAVALMPEAEFRASVVAADAEEDQTLRRMADSGPHELMKARLIHEKRTRVKLVKELGELRAQKASLGEHVGAQQRVLTELQMQLRSVESATKPLQAVLAPGLPLKTSRAADLLPTSLYIAYSQLMAAREALQAGCTVSIKGSVEEAEVYARTVLTSDPIPNAGAPSTAHTPPDDVEELYKPHPLSVDVQVHKEATLNPGSTRAPAVILTVTLQYLPKLNVVTAHCPAASDNTLLKALFPGDDGATMPIEALAQLQRGTFRYSAARTARPFRWCQHLAGLDFVATLPQLALQLSPGDAEGSLLAGLDHYRRQQRAVCILQRLRAAKLGDVALNSLAAPILRNQLPDMAPYEKQAPSSVVMVWEQVAASGGEAPVLPKSPRASGGSGSRRPAHSAPSGQRMSGTVVAGEAASGPQASVAASHGEPSGLDDGEVPPESLATATGGAASVAADGGQDGTRMEVDSSGADLGLPPQDDAAEEGEALDGDLGLQPPGSTHELDDEVDDGSRLRGDRRASARLPLPRLVNEQLDSEEDDGGAAAAVVTPPPSKRFRLVARSAGFELEVAVRLFVDYPLRPPLFRVVALRPLGAPAKAAFAAHMAKPSGSTLRALQAVQAGEPLGPQAAANSVFWFEQQVNVAALRAVPKPRVMDTLLYQVLHLRLCLDKLTEQLGGVGGPVASERCVKALPGGLAELHLRQQLVSKELVPPGPAAFAPV